MSMLVKLLPADVNCLIENLAPDSSLIPKLRGSYLLISNQLPVESTANAIICSEIEAHELLLIALEHCSKAAIQEIKSAMRLCGL
jgi:hypothetical protein